MTNQTAAETYRSYADREHRIASEATLENVRRLHSSAAARWAEMAERAERHGSRASALIR